MNHNEDNTYYNSKTNDVEMYDDNHDDEIDNDMHNDVDDIDFLDDLDLDNLNNDILPKSDCVCTDKRDASEITLKILNKLQNFIAIINTFFVQINNVLSFVVYCNLQLYRVH